MSGELVPQGLPYGERQNQQQAMSQAGLSTELPAGQNPQTISPVAPEGQPLDFDPFDEISPPTGPVAALQPSFRERIAAAAFGSPNPMMREAARRILGEQ